MKIGQEINNWIILDILDNNKIWCRCKCGKEQKVSVHNLKYGKNKGCKTCAKTKHGMSYSRIYCIWENMISRATIKQPDVKKRAKYLDVDVCDDWRNSFDVFSEWALTNGYSDNLTIDRVDNEKGYYPDNCRWITMQQNHFNRRSNTNSTSKYKGVYKKELKNKTRWIANIKHNQKTYYIGVFDSETEAAEAYNTKAKELFGECAYINKLN